jgi:hypothetical protein
MHMPWCGIMFENQVGNAVSCILSSEKCANIANVLGLSIFGV